MEESNDMLRVKMLEIRNCEDKWGYFPTIFCPSFGTIIISGQTGEDQIPPEIAHEKKYSEKENQVVRCEDFLSRQDYPYGESWMIISRDSGANWTNYGMPPIYAKTVLKDKTWLGFEFNTYRKVNKNDMSSAETVIARAWTSCDNGEIWRGPLYIPFFSPKLDGSSSNHSIALHRSIIECPDSSLLVTAYGKLKNDKKYRTMVYRSIDRGKSFTYYATVGLDQNETSPEGFDEPVISILPNGDLICIMRTGGYSPLFKSYSSDYGATWSKPEYIGQSGVSPDLKVLSNGILACSFGRPDVSVMFTSDGNGSYWPEKSLVWRNANKKEGLVIGNDYWSYDVIGTCGYTGLAEIAAGKVMLVFSAPKDPSDQSIDNPWELEKRKKMTIWMITYEVKI